MAVLYPVHISIAQAARQARMGSPCQAVAVVAEAAGSVLVRLFDVG